MSRNEDGTTMRGDDFAGDAEFNQVTYNNCQDSQYTCEGTVTFDAGKQNAGKQIEFRTGQSPEYGDRTNFRKDINEAVNKSRQSDIPPRQQQYDNPSAKPGGGGIEKQETRSQDQSLARDGNQLKSQGESMDEGGGFSQSR